MQLSGPDELRDWMRRRGFTQADAARYLDYEESLMSKILNGQHRPGLQNAVNIERLTGIPVEAWASELVVDAERPMAAAGKRRVAK